MYPISRLELVKYQERPALPRGALPKARPSPYPNRVAPLFLPKQPNPPRHIPRLPNDIIHLIVESLCDDIDFDDEFADDPFPFLARLCLISKDFLHPARKALYTSIFIFSDFVYPLATCRRLCDSLIRHPHLAARVRRIEIREDPPPPPPAPTAPDGPRISISSYLKLLEPVCTAVNSLRVFLWFKEGLTQAGATDIFKALGLFAPRLKRLELIVTSEESMGEKVSALLRLARGLKVLKYRGPPLDEPPAFELEELIVSEGSGAANFDALTQSSRSSLRTLDYSSGTGRGRVPTPDLTRFPNLEFLRVLIQYKKGAFESLTSSLLDLPLRHLDLKVRSRHTHVVKCHNIPTRLPHALTHLRLDVKSTDNITSFLKSGSCPLLSSATFRLKAKPDPWTRLAVARAAKARGLRVAREEPD
ncbi:hypothetical protein RQP46_008483 [Phenoliferia psychrophenolica]